MLYSTNLTLPLASWYVLGTVGETFSRALAKFREQKLLAVKGKAVTVLSPAKSGALRRRNSGE